MLRRFGLSFHALLPRMAWFVQLAQNQALSFIIQVKKFGSVRAVVVDFLGSLEPPHTGGNNSRVSIEIFIDGFYDLLVRRLCHFYFVQHVVAHCRVGVKVESFFELNDVMPVFHIFDPGSRLSKKQSIFLVVQQVL